MNDSIHEVANRYIDIGREHVTDNYVTIPFIITERTRDTISDSNRTYTLEEVGYLLRSMYKNVKENIKEWRQKY